MVVRNITKNTILSDKCLVAGSFASRFMGLMGRSGIAPGSGLLIVPCNSIHMFFMKFPIDIVFLDKGNKVVYIVEGIRPWKVSKLVRNAHSVLELPSGTVKTCLTEVGDKLEFK
jgi:uncharacterized protein